MNNEDVTVSSPPRRPIMGKRLLGLSEVSEITGFCTRIASEVMDDTGRAFMLRNQKFVFESEFFEWLEGQRTANGCSRRA